ncbi:hypothetical protein [Clostridium botulinum]|uniref:hypothetical protein n=2 Tax=Clostridium botulinum TaxID=1491 RepID=UPI0002E1E272|nr:hypothetical protein [Clostridium botulinum]
MIRLKYFDTIRHLLRSGKASDPYVLKVTQEKIINNKLNLDEIPDPLYHVRIEDYVEIDENTYYKTREIKSNQFYVEYDNGVLYFNPTEEGKTVKIEYKGRGVLQFPAERIWVHNPNPWVIDNLQEFIDFIFEKTQEITEYIEYLKNLVKKKIDEMDIHIAICKKQTDECKKISEDSLRVKKETEQVRDKCIDTTNESIVVTQGCIHATKNCDEQTKIAKRELELLEIDRLHTKIQWLAGKDVKTLAEIEKDYPHPEVGDCVITTNGEWYRWDGVKWQFITNITGGITLATEEINGLLSKNDFIKLKGIEDDAQKNYVGEEAKSALPSYVHTKTIIFELPLNKFKQGVQDVFVKFPMNGQITNINAICQKPSVDFTSIQVQKIQITDFNKGLDNWINICEDNKEIMFDYGAYSSSKCSILNNKVNKDDCFRLNFKHVGNGIENISVYVDILI